MTPTPEQIAEWREEFEKSLPVGERQILPSQGYAIFRVEFEWRGYIRARTEQATEIAELKAKLAEVMPLARFGAEIANHLAGTGSITVSAMERMAARGVLTQDEREYAPNIEATIEQLLKD